ncbi:hypothetical protein NJB1907f44_48960 [Mycobacterium marinum]|uniref:hypothetical protein n=1 Tax=Mycobacterium marinum TaxID=1781 RepID=UPI000E3E39CE|nr:hypothetical protein [Mycobacterium marinum]RFZ30718.1 hypothetical protein KST_05034 [Mycobacterium marinum]GJN99117.1 hypothetical protein NJB1907E8_50310 [Mycobacterium marinum]GJO06040.1 hypothetical protein NJB1907E90_16750 [Mycobacterium marinum]GJO10654.1 hypothetical protein NJB1808e29_46610 [Mycobacterium marinum]GJO14484.1 hypothetical protein NJB1907f34b_50970 [Mycobacterium marinum]
MTAVIITPAPGGGRATVRFRYDPAVVSLIKSTVPSFARSWDAQRRVWFIDTDWTPALAAELAGRGHTVTGHAARTTDGGSDWATALFRAVGPQRTPAVHRALTRVLHPDTATGCPVLQRELNDARAALEARI